MYSMWTEDVIREGLVCGNRTISRQLITFTGYPMHSHQEISYNIYLEIDSDKHLFFSNRE